MSVIKKRPLASEENMPPVALKQAKLVFGSGNQLKLEAEPKKPKPMAPNDFFEHAIAPLKGNSWMSKIENELNSPYVQNIFKKLGEEAKNVSFLF